VTRAQIVPALAGHVHGFRKLEQPAVGQNILFKQSFDGRWVFAIVVSRVLLHSEDDLFGAVDCLYLIALSLYLGEGRHR